MERFARCMLAFRYAALAVSGGYTIFEVRGGPELKTGKIINGNLELLSTEEVAVEGQGKIQVVIENYQCTSAAASIWLRG